MVLPEVGQGLAGNYFLEQGGAGTTTHATPAWLVSTYFGAPR